MQSEHSFPIDVNTKCFGQTCCTVAIDWKTDVYTATQVTVVNGIIEQHF